MGAGFLSPTKDRPTVFFDIGYHQALIKTGVYAGGTVDVPMIQVPTMREVFEGNGPTRRDGDTPGNQFRIYEFAGMAHIDSRDAVAYYPDPCKLPISRFPLAAYMSVALNHLWQWLDKGTVPPHADRFYVDFNTDKDGSLLALDETDEVVQ